MPITSTPTIPAAATSRPMIAPSLRQRFKRGDATAALPAPMPRINAISTTANACNDAPKISVSERDASTSNPIETAPVSATRSVAHRIEVEPGLSVAAALSVVPMV